MDPDSVNIALSCASLIVGSGAAPAGVAENAATSAPSANTERPSLRYVIHTPSSNTPTAHRAAGPDSEIVSPSIKDCQAPDGSRWSPGHGFRFSYAHSH